MIYIYGATYHGIVIADIIYGMDLDDEICFIDNTGYLSFYNYPVKEAKYIAKEPAIDDLDGIVYHGIIDNKNRAKIQLLNMNGWAWPFLINPKSYIDDNTALGAGTQILYNTIILRSNIGEGTIIRNNVVIENAQIGQFCNIGNNVVIKAGSVIENYIDIPDGSIINGDQ